MEWIRISANKLKIMLSAEDTRHYALDCEHADYADALTRAVFRDILTDVRRETGFDATEDKVYIQMYPSKEGGCELFVTKVGLLMAERPAEAPPKDVPESAAREARESAFVFEKLSFLLLLCRRLRTANAETSEAWRDDGGRWWLLLTAKSDLSFAREYGKEAGAAAARLFLCEHGTAICAARAVETLGRL